MRAARWAALLPVVSGLVVVALGVGAAVSLGRDVSASVESTLYRLPLSPVPSITMVDSTEEVIYRRQLSPGVWTHLALPDLAAWQIDLLLLSEDKRFFTHPGIDLLAIGRAAASNVAGVRNRQGASTLTQQVVKMVLGTPERTVRAKLVEAMTAVILDRRSAKTDVLEAYLNRVYFGRRIYGFAAASVKRFGKEVGDLEPAEFARLVAALPSPSGLWEQATPELDYRVHLLLERAGMLGTGSEDAVTRRAERAGDAPGSVSSGFADVNLYPYAASYVLNELRRTLGGEFGVGALTVRTTIDSAVQSAAENAVYDYITLLRLRDLQSRSELPLNGAAIVLDSESAAVRAIVGGTRYSRDDQFNRAVGTFRPIGSTVKPFVYAAAADALGLTVESRVSDEPVAIDDPVRGGYEPDNHYYGHEGEVTVGKAISRSINTVGLRLAYDLGLDATAEAIASFLQSPVVSATSPGTLSYDIALGNVSSSLYRLTRGYTVFVTEGILMEPWVIRDVRDRSGRIVLHREPAQGVRVASSGAAAVIREAMEGVFSFGGTAYRTDRTYPFGIAGKTGSFGGDSWFVGFSRHYLTGVWIGLEDSRSRLPQGVRFSSHWVFHTIMESIHPFDYRQRF